MSANSQTSEIEPLEEAERTACYREIAEIENACAKKTLV